MASYLPNAEQFIDLRRSARRSYKDQYLPWKWDRGHRPRRQMVGFPIDCGPVAALLPARGVRQGGAADYDPGGRRRRSWTPGRSIFAAGERLKKRVPGAHAGHRRRLTIYQNVVAQGTKRYVDKERHFIGDQEHVRRAWNMAVEATSAACPPGPVRHPGRTRPSRKASCPASSAPPGPAGDIKTGCPKTKGKWRVGRMPGGPANNGGSFLAITKPAGTPSRPSRSSPGCSNADNQARGFTDAALFPSTPPRTAGGDAGARPVLRRPGHHRRLRLRRREDPGRLPTARTTTARDQAVSDELKNVSPGQGPRAGLEGRHGQVPAHSGSTWEC